jgi:hypothetical protein
VYGPGRNQLERLVAGLGLHCTHQAQVTPATLPGGERYGGTAVAFDQPVDGIWASDHFGVVVDLDLGRDA